MSNADDFCLNNFYQGITINNGWAEAEAEAQAAAGASSSSTSFLLPLGWMVLFLIHPSPQSLWLD